MSFSVFKKMFERMQFLVDKEAVLIKYISDGEYYNNICVIAKIYCKESQQDKIPGAHYTISQVLEMKCTGLLKEAILKISEQESLTEFIAAINKVKNENIILKIALGTFCYLRHRLTGDEEALTLGARLNSLHAIYELKSQGFTPTTESQEFIKSNFPGFMPSKDKNTDSNQPKSGWLFPTLTSTM